MTALAVVLLMGAAAPALAAPGDQQDQPERADRGDGGRTDHDRVQRDNGPARPRSDWSQRSNDGGQRDGGQRDGGQRGSWTPRDGRPTAPTPAATPRPAPPAPQPAQTTEQRRGWNGDAAGRQGWTRGAGFQDRAGSGQRTDGDPRTSDRRGADFRGGDDRRGDDRRDWDHRSDDHRNDDHRGDDRRNWDPRGGDYRGNDYRGGNNWDHRGDDRSHWDRHDWNHDWPHWERGRYPSTYFSHARYRSSWRAPPGFYVRIWSFGDFLPRAWYGPDYWLIDPWTYDLPLPPPGFDWVRVGADALLVDQYTGRVVQVVRDLFW